MEVGDVIREYIVLDSFREYMSKEEWDNFNSEVNAMLSNENAIEVAFQAEYDRYELSGIACKIAMTRTVTQEDIDAYRNEHMKSLKLEARNKVVELIKQYPDLAMECNARMIRPDYAKAVGYVMECQEWYPEILDDAVKVYRLKEIARKISR